MNVLTKAVFCTDAALWLYWSKYIKTVDRKVKTAFDNEGKLRGE